MQRLEPHAIVKLLNDQLVRGADELYAIDAATAARVRDELCAITSGPALTRAARDLI